MPISPVLLSVLGGVEMLMAASAAPAPTVVAGAVGGVVVGVAAWVPRRGRRIGLVVAGSVPLAALTWWSVVTPLLAVVAIGIVVLRPVRAPDHRSAAVGHGGRPGLVAPESRT